MQILLRFIAFASSLMIFPCNKNERKNDELKKKRTPFAFNFTDKLRSYKVAQYKIYHISDALNDVNSKPEYLHLAMEFAFE